MLKTDRSKRFPARPNPSRCCLTTRPDMIPLPARFEPMRFSHILRTVRRTAELAECLAALDAQTYRGFELIVVDQNLDNRVEPILAPYKGKFDTLHLKSQRQGLAREKILNSRTRRDTRLSSVRGGCAAAGPTRARRSRTDC